MSKYEVLVACLVIVGTLLGFAYIKIRPTEVSAKSGLSESKVDIREKRRALFESKKVVDSTLTDSEVVKVPLPQARCDETKATTKQHTSSPEQAVHVIATPSGTIQEVTNSVNAQHSVSITQAQPKGSEPSTGGPSDGSNEYKVTHPGESYSKYPLHYQLHVRVESTSGPTAPSVVDASTSEMNVDTGSAATVKGGLSPDDKASTSSAATPTPSAQPPLSEDTSPPPVPSTTAYIFGTDPVPSLTEMLLAVPVTSAALRLAAAWWTRALELSVLDIWRNDITAAVAVLIRERLPEEDLFTPRPADDLAAVYVELLGYAVVSTQSIGHSANTLRISSCKDYLHPDFVKMLFSTDTVSAATSLRFLFSPFASYRLDCDLRDIISGDILDTLSRDKAVGAALGVVLAQEAEESASQLHPGTMAFTSVLAPILYRSSIVPFSQIPFRQERHLGSVLTYPQIAYFDSMPTFSSPSRLGCPNMVLLAQQRNLIQFNTSRLLEPLKKVIELGMKLRLRDGILAWFARVLSLTHRFFSQEGRGAYALEEKNTSTDATFSFCSSGFSLNVISLLLQLCLPLFEHPAKYLSAVDWAYLLHDFRVEFSALPNIIDGSKPGLAVTSATDENEPFTGAPHLPTPTLGFTPASQSGVFSFPTEIFWLTSRAMELVDKLDKRRGEQLRLARNHFDAVEQVYKVDPSPSNALLLNHARKCFHLVHYGWEASQLTSSEFLSHACQWAKFASDWIILQAAAVDGPARFHRIPAGLVKGMCNVWIQAAHYCPDTALPGIMAADAALLCVELMSRPELASSPVVQDCLLTVVDTFVRSGKPSLVGVVMHNQRIRETLAPAVMSLYSACHAVTALDVNEDTSFDKNSIRHRSNKLIIHLCEYPLDEPRKSIVAYCESDRSFSAFVGSAFDCIIYTFVEAVKTLAEGTKLEQIGRPVNPQVQRKVQSLLRISTSTFTMLSTLCEKEVSIRQRLTAPCLYQRVASALYTCLYYISSEEKLTELRVKDPSEWGYDEYSIVGDPVRLLALCLDTSDLDAQGAFVRALIGHPDFENGAMERISEFPGGLPLKQYLGLFRESVPGGAPLDRIEGIDWNEWAAQEEGAEEQYSALLESFDVHQVVLKKINFCEIWKLDFCVVCFV